jgi:hypothetical protein
VSVWIDPIPEELPFPKELSSKETNTLWYSLGDARYQLLPKQYQFLNAPEPFVGYIGGYGSGKTRIGSIKAAWLSCTTPGNRGLIGMDAATDLSETAERDFLEFVQEAKLLKKAPTSQSGTAIIHVVHPKTFAPLGYESEVQFVHLDDAAHVRGRHLGWFWIDEGSKTKRDAWQNLIGRLRLPVFKRLYVGIVTGNPEGHNWIYDFFFNQELLEGLICGKPGCTLSDFDCNQRLRKQRRAFHCTSYENYFLPPDYIDHMVTGFTDEERRRYVEASFDVFVGMVFKEWDPAKHVIPVPANWVDGRPPREWQRVMAVDVGGASPWAFLWCAVDPDGNLVFYDEIYKVSTNVDELAVEALPKMVDEERQPYQFRAKVIDYENKVAATDLQRRGITLTNAAKHGKAGSVSRMSGYLHPHAKHHFPEYHPRAGQSNSPRMFVTSNCKNFIREIPQQRWLEQTSGFTKDEMDRRIANHAVDCCLYITREVPEARDLKPASPMGRNGVVMGAQSLMSQMYWADVKRREENKPAPGRSPYRIKQTSLDLFE